jgi:hypothetical protein
MKKLHKWTDERIKMLLECDTDEDLKSVFPELTLESARRMQRLFRGENKETFESYLSKGRTIKDIAERFKISDTEAVKRVNKAPEGYEFFESINLLHQKIFVLLPKPKKEIKIKDRSWKFARQPNGQPYIWINFPQLSLSKIKILPIADSHYGAHEFNQVKFLEYLHFIERNENVFCILVGDIFENCNGESNRGISIFDQEITPTQQRENMLHMLAPIAHKILWAVPGNHENRSRKFDFDPLEYVCHSLGIPYFQEPVYADILWNDHLFTFYTQHGRSGSLTEGGKINAAMRPLEYQEHVMFTFYAHVHDAKTTRPTRIVRDRENFKLVLKKQYVVICPAFLNYFGSYASKMALKPGAWGTIACEMYANGDYHAST